MEIPVRCYQKGDVIVIEINRIAFLCRSQPRPKQPKHKGKQQEQGVTQEQARATDEHTAEILAKWIKHD